jgi:hypothetical protein
MRAPHLEALFPNLRASGYYTRSPRDPRYNCIAWAANNTRRWFEPDPFGLHYWPAALPRNEYTLENYADCFIKCGYMVTRSAAYQAGYEKVALYVDSYGIPSHAARMTKMGIWSSKIGEYEDIEHNTLGALEGSDYGAVKIILKRRLRMGKWERVMALLRINRLFRRDRFPVLRSNSVSFDVFGIPPEYGGVVIGRKRC